MAKRFGNSSASSLVKSAQAAAERAAAYQDQIQSYQYDLSPKTEDDFKTYQDYLTKRLKTTSDPSKALSVQKNITTAYRSFNSAEISRQSMAVAYGEQDNRTKYQNMLGLYQAAVQNGDMNLAQSIDAQLGRLSVTIQNEDQVAAGRAEASGRAYTSGLNKAYNAEITKQKQELDRAKVDLAAGRITAAEYADHVAGHPESPMVVLQGIYQQASQDESLDETARARFEDNFNKFQTDNKDQAGLLDAAKFKAGQIPGAVKYNERSGQYEYVPLKQTGVTQRVDEHGNFVGVPVMGADTNLSKEQSGAVRAGELLIDKRTGQRSGPISDSQAVLQPYTVDSNGNAVYIDPDTGKVIAAQDLGGENATRSLLQPRKDANYGLIQDEQSGKYRFSTKEDFKSEMPTIFSKAGVGERLHNSANFLAGGLNLVAPALRHIPGAGSVFDAFLNSNNQRRAQEVAKQAEAKRQADLAAYQQQVLARNAASRAALNAVPKANPAKPVTVNYNNGRLENAVGPRAIPAETQQAANTVGTEDFTKKYLPVVGKLGF